MQVVSLTPCGTIQRRTHRSTEVDLCFIAGRLGLMQRPRRTIVEKVRVLAEHHGFPLPKTPRIVKGVRILGPRAIDAFSIWDRDAVELWLEGDRPPEDSAAAIVVRRSAVRAEMGKRAQGLVLVASNG